MISGAGQAWNFVFKKKARVEVMQRATFEGAQRPRTRTTETVGASRQFSLLPFNKFQAYAQITRDMIIWKQSELFCEHNFFLRSKCIGNPRPVVTCLTSSNLLWFTPLIPLWKFYPTENKHIMNITNMPVCFVFTKARAARHFLLGKGMLWENCQLLLDHFKGTKAIMTRGALRQLPLLPPISFRPTYK